MISRKASGENIDFMSNIYRFKKVTLHITTAENVAYDMLKLNIYYHLCSCCQSVQGKPYRDKCTVCHLDRVYDYKNLKIWLLPTVYIVQIAIMKMCDERCFKNCWGPPSSTLKIEFDSPSHNSCSCIYSKQQFCDLPHLSSTTTQYII